MVFSWFKIVLRLEEHLDSLFIVLCCCRFLGLEVHAVLLILRLLRFRAERQ